MMVTETQAPKRDIYELLGVDPSASTILAQEVYWRRVNAYLDADRAGDPEARAAITELNDALAIILDEPRRAEYDRQRGKPSVRPGTEVRWDPEARARRRGMLVLLMVPLLGLAMWAASGVLGAFAGVAVGVVGLGVLLLAARWANEEMVDGVSPFRVLHLVETASVEDVDGAYQSEVNRLLLRVRHDRSALRQLEALDAAYIRALEILARGATLEAAPAKAPSFLGRAAGRAGNVLAGAVLAASTWLVMLLRSVANRAARAMGAATRAGWSAARERGGAQAPIITVPVDVDRRLATAFRDVATRVAEPQEAGTEAPAPPEPLVRASLVLDSMAGKRSVPVGGVPVRIGSDGACDLVLRREGVAPEHVLVWLRDDAVMLHVIQQGASCLVNGQQIGWAMLEDGDEVALGEASFKVSIAE